MHTNPERPDEGQVFGARKGKSIESQRSVILFSHEALTERWSFFFIFVPLTMVRDLFDLPSLPG